MEEFATARVSNALQWQTRSERQLEADNTALAEAKKYEQETAHNLVKRRLDRRTIVIGLPESVSRYFEDYL